ncbi:hypothetical protein KCV87_13975 [Actinosynnema pretiosum subsp. pretiosum]|uniref:Uncharacterized protein n=3 Tax=Actinosynnema TaxID=40566 RepID=C6WRJ6_ACTMD|nr:MULTISPECIES: hypothetical protein [Actinosynnema]ACU35248.1 hypothetical protein Amir_1296 [Actinosynnema mirum DSM 43827]ATE52954.1 hypothetical protein CNX65_06405 [Actinosynnema pretiosum]AXX28621.1 hypothetical protein APASM_1256 [Actinosynnema pretiosum subsp. pretiosum]QUF08370.1 hypothetical protein KCV87_13975 [Actinosynnema pretiosum subsp. pretiosum]
MKGILFGAAIGYVLGARAGKARYDQIVRAYRAVVDHPAVQGAAGIVRAKIGQQTTVGRKYTAVKRVGVNGQREPVAPRVR